VANIVREENSIEMIRHNRAGLGRIGKFIEEKSPLYGRACKEEDV